MTTRTTLGKTLLNIACRDFEASTRWYAEIFGRAPDALPGMARAEWHDTDAPGLALTQDATRTVGHHVVALRISDIGTQRERVGVIPEEERAYHPAAVRLSDPDGNTVVLSM